LSYAAPADPAASESTCDVYVSTSDVTAQYNSTNPPSGAAAGGITAAALGTAALAAIAAALL
jgi:hypothetical protein